MRYNAFIYKCLMFLAMGMTAASCNDDTLYPDRGNGPEGEPAVVTLNVTLPSRSSYTRATLSEADDNRVNSLWVGIYNVATGKFTGGGFMNSDNGFEAGQKDHSTYTLKNIKTKSGTSRIVAVANYENHNGVSLDEKDTSLPLKDLLADADSWDKYQKIIIKSDLTFDEKNADIETPAVGETSALLMSGLYIDGKIESHETGFWKDNENASVYIPSGTSAVLASGAIHLRRILSHIKFTLQATDNIIEIQPLSYQVFNVPTYNWLNEKYSEAYEINAGDALNMIYENNGNYPSSLIFPNNFISQSKVNNITVYSFDFWQMENKRTGVTEHCTKYEDRELMYGVGFTKPSATEPHEQSEFFYSLCDGAASLNNKASYVDIPCIIKYRNKTTDQTTPGGDSLPSGAIRTANVTYRIHLGYIDNIPTDFNSYRNSEYTYNLTVKDVYNVIVEAYREEDNTPGAIGNVTDVTDNYFELDSHFGVLNIYLTEDDLKSFSFSMETYDSQVRRTVQAGLKDAVSNIPDKGTTDYYDYYDWIEIVKAPITETQDPNNSDQALTIATYPGKGHESILHLGDLVDNKNLTEGWYTVFVREYTFETADPINADYGNESKEAIWTRYVGQPNRNVWMNVAESVSADGKTAYFKAKYAISQKSIQTYYSTTSLNTNKNALGVEHTNETLGLNLRWTDAVGSITLDPDNGRYNTWRGAGGVNDGTTAGQWKSYLNTGRLLHINSVNNQGYNNNGGNTAYVMQPEFLTGLTAACQYNDIPSRTPNVRSSAATPFDPQTNSGTAQYIQILNACLSRNRDENGNGTIDAPELKWYLASSGHYLRLILGRNALDNPLMDYNTTPSTPYNNTSRVDINGSIVSSGGYLIGNGLNGRYHYISSDGKIVWGEEGLSSSDLLGKPYSTAPWQLRCVRSLGMNLTNIIQSRKVDPAYTYDGGANGGVVQIVSYYGTSLRNPTSSVIAPHFAYQDNNRLGQYGFEFSSDIQYQTASSENNYISAINNNTYCSSLNSTTSRSGWRTPNQKEVIIMGRIGVLTNHTFWWTCTRESYGSSGVLGGNGARWATYRGSDRFGGAINYSQISGLRCVRDLTAAEKDMKYNAILNYKTN